VAKNTHPFLVKIGEAEGGMWGRISISWRMMKKGRKNNFAGRCGKSDPVKRQSSFEARAAGAIEEE